MEDVARKNPEKQHHGKPGLQPEEKGECPSPNELSQGRRKLKGDLQAANPF